MTKLKNQTNKCKAFALQTETKDISIRVAYEQMEFHPRKDNCVTILKSNQCGKERNKIILRSQQIQRSHLT